jgi:5-amino-6-(5-phosphoribosylamino)uracil reductase
MSADGKIADAKRSPAKFGSANDKTHLERQVAKADAVLFGATTLRSGGTAMRVVDPALIAQREQQGQPPQPIQILASKSGNIDPELPFFRQNVPRWLITTDEGGKNWQGKSQFDRILVCQSPTGETDWMAAFQQMANLGIKTICVLGGGELIATLMAADLIDEFSLTVCPLILGGATAPTPVQGEGFLQNMAPRLELLSWQAIDQEIFLHYRLKGRGGDGEMGREGEEGEIGSRGAALRQRGAEGKLTTDS